MDIFKAILLILLANQQIDGRPQRISDAKITAFTAFALCPHVLTPYIALAPYTAATPMTKKIRRVLFILLQYMPYQFLLELLFPGSRKERKFYLDRPNFDGVTYTVPIYEGYALPHSIVATRDVMKCIRRFLK